MAAPRDQFAPILAQSATRPGGVAFSAVNGPRRSLTRLPLHLTRLPLQPWEDASVKTNSGPRGARWGRLTANGPSGCWNGRKA
jgi:hypothetical protein